MKPSGKIKLLLVATALLLIPRRSSRQTVTINNKMTNKDNSDTNINKGFYDDCT